MEIKQILKNKNIDSDYTELSNKDDVIVLELIDMPNKPILKYFGNDEFRREIYYYSLFRNTSIQTINVLKFWEDAILLENMNNNSKCRLATQEDLLNKKIVVALAKWYKGLHNMGREVLKRENNGITYSEINLLNNDELNILKEKIAYKNENYWILLHEMIHKIYPYYLRNQSITYNDFYFGNVIVSKDRNEAFMFDYNFVGKGLAYFDVANVLSGLDPKMHNVFLQAYGESNEFEKDINKVISPIIALIIAFKKDAFPYWAKVYLNRLVSDELYSELLEFSQIHSSINL